MLSLLSIVAVAQNRIVRGVVFDSSRNPFVGAVISVDGQSVTAESKIDGTFEISVPVYCRSISASKVGYLSQTLEIDGSYLVFTMKEDKKRAEARAIFVDDSTAAAQAALKAAKDEEARIAAEKAAAKKAAKKAATEKYDSQYKNHGLVKSIDFTYGYQPLTGDVVFKDMGWRDYGDQIPFQLTSSIGYRVNCFFAVSAGAGVLYDVKNIAIKNDTFAEGYYPNFKLHRIDVPIFVKADLFMTKGKVQPLLSMSGGLYVLSETPLIDGGIGCSIRMSKSSAINILAGVRTTPWPFFHENSSSSGYMMALTPSVKVGFSF